ncbi:unnamed protein product [Larinioides sclopetarius]|uniref:ATP synthase F0 subunit 8 n=1 Tax=Larinioides sclopetarius TaxID=280406 RepID=A0AAV1ZJV8_9ARAC
MPSVTTSIVTIVFLLLIGILFYQSRDGFSSEEKKMWIVLIFPAFFCCNYFIYKLCSPWNNQS